MPNLTTVILPANLTGIPKDAFAGSTKLATVKFGTDAGNNPSAKDVTGEDNKITLPSKITTIDANAFAGTAATAVDLSGVTGLTTIDNSVFQGMTSLTEVKLPATITTIRDNAFQGDVALKTLSQESPKAARDEATTTPDTTATFGKSLISIGQNAFNGTGFSTIDLSKAGGTSGSASSSPSTPTQTLTVGSNAFTNMANLTTVKLPANADINPTYFGNPADAAATAPKLNSIMYVGADSSSSSATITLTDTTISSPNFSKIQNPTIQINSNTSSTINFNGGVFNGNITMTKLMLNVTQRNGNTSL